MLPPLLYTRYTLVVKLARSINKHAEAVYIIIQFVLIPLSLSLFVKELERLALEQYNSASSTDTSAGGQGNECNPLHEPPCGGKMSPYAALLLANSVLVGFYRSVVNTRLLTNLYSNVSRNR